MAQRDERRSILYNVVSDVVRKRVPLGLSISIVRTTIQTWEKIVGPDPAAHPEVDDRAATVFEDVLGALPEDKLCQGPSCDVGSTPVSRITDHLGVWTNNIHKSAVAPPREGLPDANFWRDLEATGLVEQQVIRGSKVRGGRPFAWITTTETVEMICQAKPRQIATEIRDHLGLDHFEPGVELLELQYPEDALKEMRVAAPTYIEGGTNPAYQSVTRPDGWGATRRLGGGDGGPEAVHPQIVFTHRFRLRYLGVVDSDPRPVDGKAEPATRVWDDEAAVLMSILSQDDE